MKTLKTMNRVIPNSFLRRDVDGQATQDSSSMNDKTVERENDFGLHDTRDTHDMTVVGSERMVQSVCKIISSNEFSMIV